MINGKLSWTAGRRADTSGRRQRGPRARAAAECRPGRGWASPAHASVLAIVAVNRDPLGLAELTEIEGLDSTIAVQGRRPARFPSLVRRRRDPDDYRAARVEVTADGEEV